MYIDPTNEIVKLCVKGIEAEAAGDSDYARQLSQEAWDKASNDFEAFIAAHYLARHQNPEGALKWNMEALIRATGMKDDNIRSHLPSLYLNVARSFEELKDPAGAVGYYNLAADNCVHLPPGPYGEMIKSGIQEGLRRCGESRFSNPALERLIDRWCGRKELRPLAMVLPAYFGNLGTLQERNKLISALSRLTASRLLPADEQDELNRIIRSLAKDVMVSDHVSA